MPRSRYVLALVFLFHLAIPDGLSADLNNNWVINHEIAERIETLKKQNGYSSEDFNACQIKWTTRPLEKADQHSPLAPHEITFYYESKEIVKLVNTQDGNAESIQGLGLNCLEFNKYIYLFFDTLNDETRSKFNLTDLSYVLYSADTGSSWSPLISLDQFSTKAKFAIPSDKFRQCVKIFGDRFNHALSIYNVRDETTYLFSPEFEILKSVPVYNRISDFDNPSDFYYYKNIIYLARGSCDNINGRIQCPPRTYLETSRDFGKTWNKENLPLIRKSYFLTLDNTLHHFYYKSCPSHWFNIVPGLNYSLVCGYIQVRKLNIVGQWEKPKTLIKTAHELIGIYKDAKPILVWNDFRFHNSRMCGYIPVIGCIDSNPFKGPMVTYAGTLNISDWHIEESMIDYKVK